MDYEEERRQIVGGLKLSWNWNFRCGAAKVAVSGSANKGAKTERISRVFGTDLRE